MNNIYYGADYTPHLSHHGIKGQKWGVRRYQNPDGSLTAEGRERYGDEMRPTLSGHDSQSLRTRFGNTARESQAVSKIDKNKVKKAAKIGVGIAAGLITAYGIKKLVDVGNDKYYTKLGNESAERFLNIYRSPEASEWRSEDNRLNKRGMAQVSSGLDFIYRGMEKKRNSARGIAKIKNAYRYYASR